MWKVIKMNKKFCKLTAVVLAEACKVLKTNSRVYFSGKKNRGNRQGKFICCILGNIMKNDTCLLITSNSSHKRKTFVKSLKKITKLSRKLLMSIKHIFKLSFLLKKKTHTAKRVENQCHSGRLYMQYTLLNKESTTEYIKSS